MILLSFDVEEFDMPFEYGKELAFDEQLSISTQGANIVLDLLKETGIKVTFYCTANYAQHKPNIIQRMVKEGHEVASHGFYHSKFENADLLASRKLLEELTDTPIRGFRMARMQPVSQYEMRLAGYKYNSSLNPTWIPGRYNNFKSSRKWFWEENVLQIPASVSPNLRFPLFWLSFHNLPMGILKWLSDITYRKDGYLNIYFHPWEFTDLHQPEKYGFPAYVSRNTGDAFTERIREFINWAKSKGYQFARTGDFAQEIIHRKK